MSLQPGWKNLTEKPSKNNSNKENLSDVHCESLTCCTTLACTLHEQDTPRTVAHGRWGGGKSEWEWNCGSPSAGCSPAASSPATNTRPPVRTWARAADCELGDSEPAATGAPLRSDAWPVGSAPSIGSFKSVLSSSECTSWQMPPSCVSNE